jgi:thioredoxin 1
MAVRSWLLVVVLAVLVAGVVVAKKTILAPAKEAPRVVNAAPETPAPSPPPAGAMAASGIPKHTLTAADFATSLASGKPTLVDFGAGTCTQCKLEAPVLDAAVEQYRGQANIVFVNTDASADLARQYGVKFIPTQIVFDRKGKEVTRHIGFHPAEAIAADLAKAGVPGAKAGVK